MDESVYIRTLDMPCVFCDRQDVDLFRENGDCFIFCVSCLAEGSRKVFEDEAIEVWQKVLSRQSVGDMMSQAKEAIALLQQNHEKLESRMREIERLNKLTSGSWTTIFGKVPDGEIESY